MHLSSRIIIGCVLCYLALASVSILAGASRGGIAMGEAPAAWQQWPVGRLYRPSAPPTIAPHSLHEYFATVPSDKEKASMHFKAAAGGSAARTLAGEVVCIEDSDDDEIAYIGTTPPLTGRSKVSDAASMDERLWAALIEGADDCMLEGAEISEAVQDLLRPMLLETDESTAEGFINRVIKVSMDVIPTERESFWKMLDDLRDPTLLIENYLSMIEALGGPGTTDAWRAQLVKDTRTYFPLEISGSARAELFCAMAKEPSNKRVAVVSTFFKD